MSLYFICLFLFFRDQMELTMIIMHVCVKIIIILSWTFHNVINLFNFLNCLGALTNEYSFICYPL